MFAAAGGQAGGGGQPASPSGAALERAARRLVRRLLASGWHIVEGEDEAVLCTAKGLHREAITPLLLDYLRQHDLIEVSPKGGFMLSPAGRSWHLRGKPDAEGFRRQHRRLAQKPGGAIVNLREDPLLWLHRRRGQDGKPLISRAEYEAGQRLQRDYLCAARAPGMVADWSRAADSKHGSHGQGRNIEIAFEARQRFETAVKALGPDLADIVVEVCCHNAGLVEAGQRLGWPRHSAKLILRIALSRLARHYGLTN